MKLNSIKIKNYRCYQDNDFDFGSDTTVIIGKNGTGKSTLLSAIRKGMTFMFSGTSKNKFKSNNNTQVEGFAIWDTRFEEDGLGFQFPTSLNYKVQSGNENLNWGFLKESFSGKLRPTHYKEALGKINKSNNKDQLNWPVLAFYGDCYPHKRREKNSRINTLNELLLTQGRIPRDIGYSFWNEDTSIASSWFNRYKFIVNLIKEENDTLDHLEGELTFLKIQRDSGREDLGKQILNEIDSKQETIKLLREKQKNETSKLIEERDFVRNKVLSFFKKDDHSNEDELVLNELSVRATGGGDFLFFSFGSNNSYSDGVYNEETLPMGYMRLIHIIFDLVYRCYIINGKDVEEKGIALIDELELHLHPSLQKVVLSKFQRTFKGIQFIITTHSPIILSKIQTNETNKVLKLDKEDKKYVSEELTDVYSTDFNFNLTKIMDVDLSNQKIDTLLSAYDYLKKENNDKLAEEYFRKISEYFENNIPHFIKNKMDN